MKSKQPMLAGMMIACVVLVACAGSETKPAAKSVAATESKTIAGQYACIPCGYGCDTLSYNDTGTCTRCNMKLVKKETIHFGKVQPDSLCAFAAANKKLLLLDVRTPAEFEGRAEQKFGRLKGALNIPVQELEARLGELSSYRDHEIVVYCSHSHRSPMASYLLTQNGFSKVTNMQGGMSVWKDMVKDADCNKQWYVVQ
jgi:rhodanese-related sulfurtransferase